MCCSIAAAARSASREIPLSSDVGGWNSAYDLYFMNSFLFNPSSHLVLNNGKVEITYNKPE